MVNKMTDIINKGGFDMLKLQHYWLIKPFFIS